MALFRRRSTEESVDESTVEGVEDGELVETGEHADAAGDGTAGFDRSNGPFDESEAELADQEVTRLDLGSLRIPGLPGVSVQLEADEATRQVHAVTAIAGDAAVQLRAFAAPRSEGLWDSLRADTLQEIRATAGARVADGVGAFGAELRAVVPARSPEGQQVRQPVRFAGVDGPRWFLQVVFLGKSAVEPDPTDDLHLLVRQTIVVRGSEAMAPGQPLGLTLPAEPQHQGADLAEGQVDEDVEDGDDAPGPESRFSSIDPFERGPEINEVR